MFSNNLKISNRQFQRTIVFDVISISLLISPKIAAAGAGKDGLISILIGTCGALLYGFLMLYFSKQIDTNYLEYCKKILGNFTATIFGLLYIIKLMISSIFVLSLFTNVIHETILPNTSSKIVLAFLILVSVYNASKEFEVRARLVELLYFIVLIPLLLLFLLGLYKIKLANLFPLMTTGTNALAQTSYAVFLTYSAIELIIFSAPTVSVCNDESKKKRSILYAIGTACVSNVLIFIVVVGLMGTTGATQKLWSTISVMQMIEIPGGFVHRQDAIMLMFWMISIFTITSTLIHYLCTITKSITNSKKQLFIVLFYAVTLFLLTMRPIRMETLFFYFGQYIAWIGFPQSILLPLILTVIAKIKSRKGGQHYATPEQS